MDYIEMNDEERSKLEEKTKKEIKKLFHWFNESTYLKSAELADKNRCNEYCKLHLRCKV